jgi:hypothetical protein
MNRHTYVAEIGQLKSAMNTVRGMAMLLRDSQNRMHDCGDIIDAESDITHLTIAADLIERTLPKP